MECNTTLTETQMVLEIYGVSHFVEMVIMLHNVIGISQKNVETRYYTIHYMWISHFAHWIILLQNKISKLGNFQNVCQNHGQNIT